MPTNGQVSYKRLRKVPDSTSAQTASTSWDTVEPITSVAIPAIGDTVLAQPVFIMDPGQAGNSPLKTATVIPTAGAAGATVLVSAFLAVITGEVEQTKASATSTPALYFPVETLGSYMVGPVTSAAASTNAQGLDIRGLRKTLAIVVSSSAGTGTLTVEASPDGTTYFVIDLFAAAATFAKQYTEGTVGTTGAGFTAVSPLAFRYIRVTVGSMGGGNTSTLTVAVK